MTPGTATHPQLRQVVIHPDPEDGGWVADVSSLPGCVSQGETKEQAITNTRGAIAVWLEGVTQVGMRIPDVSVDVQVCVV